jgi:hypothetical protein
MNYKRQVYLPAALLLALILFITAASTRLHADTGSCGGASITIPFTDVPSSNTRQGNGCEEDSNIRVLTREKGRWLIASHQIMDERNVCGEDCATDGRSTGSKR